MFDYYVQDLSLENQILGYLEEEGVVERLTNSNLVWEYAMCASDLREVMSLKQFLTSVKRYKNGDRTISIDRMPSVLTEFLGTEVLKTEVVEAEVKQLYAA